jgi:phage shock protein A
MFKAISRFFKTIGRLFTGRINEKTDSIAEDTHVVREEYNEIIEAKTRQVRDIRDAVAGLLSQQERKKAMAEKLIGEAEELEKKMKGAVAYAKKAAAGKSKEEAAGSPEYTRAMEAYKNFSSTLEEKRQRLAEIETDIETGQKQVEAYKQQLVNFQRELEKLKSEKHEAVAEITMAKHQREVSEALAGIGKDDTADQLENLRGRVRKVHSQAQVTAELAGTNADIEEAEFLSMAEESVARGEFDSLIFGEEKADAPTTSPDEEEPPQKSTEKLPE